MTYGEIIEKRMKHGLNALTDEERAHRQKYIEESRAQYRAIVDDLLAGEEKIKSAIGKLGKLRERQYNEGDISREQTDELVRKFNGLIEKIGNHRRWIEVFKAKN